MVASKHLKKGIDEFAGLNEIDRKWVVDSLYERWVANSVEHLSDEVQSLLLEQVTNVLDRHTHKPYVFLSYSSKDKLFVRKLAAKLEKAGIKIWLDEAEIKVGQSLIEKLREAIDKVDFLVVVLSQASIGSDWVKKEVDIAMNQEIKNKRIKVLPILKEKVPLPGFLEGKLFLDFTTQGARAKSSQKLIRHILTYDK